MVQTEKIGITEIWRVSRYGSGYYLRIPTNLVENLSLKPGDRLRIKIEEVTRVGSTSEE